MPIHQYMAFVRSPLSDRPHIQFRTNTKKRYRHHWCNLCHCSQGNPSLSVPYHPLTTQHEKSSYCQIPINYFPCGYFGQVIGTLHAHVNIDTSHINPSTISISPSSISSKNTSTAKESSQKNRLIWLATSTLIGIKSRQPI